MPMLSLYEDTAVVALQASGCDSDCDTESDHGCDCYSGNGP